MANLFIYDQPMTEGQAESQHGAQIWTDILPAGEEYKATSSVTITYTYDPLYRLTSANYSGGTVYTYTYDAVGNRQTMDSPEGQVGYTYDAANRLTSVGGVAYTWDDNGNLTSDGVRSYSYDHPNRLTQVVSGTLTTQYAYSGDGVRTSKTVAGDITEYVLDLAATLPVVISDTEAVYLYGLDIIAQQQAERLYYMHDGLGSVRQLLNSTGQVETNYAYDPFGVPVVEGDVSNPYQYTGEAWDAEVELLYLRARYYQPEVGRFVTKDPWRGDVNRPATLNRYVYVSNNTPNRVDPTGLQEPQPPPTPGPEPSGTPTVWDIVEEPLVDTLARDYGIDIRIVYCPGLTPDCAWRASQLKLVLEAAWDMASPMQGEKAGFKARLAPVPLYRSSEGTRPWGMGGLTYRTHITLEGMRDDWANEPGMKWVIVHELAHWWDQNEDHRLSGEILARGMWRSDLALCQVPREERGSATPTVRQWLRGREEPSDLREDWADSVTTYVYWRYAQALRPEAGGPRLISRARWEYVAQQMNPHEPQDYPWAARESEFSPR